MPNDHTAIAERLDRLSSEKARQSDRAPTSTQRVAFDDQAAFFAEAAQALRASADEVEQLREAHQDAYEQWGRASRAHVETLAELERVKAERGELDRKLGDAEAGYHDIGGHYQAALARATQAEADLASARKALEPFARAMAEYGDGPAEADGANCWEHSLAMLVTIGDFRRAAEVYASLSGRTGSEAYTAEDGPVRDEYSSSPQPEGRERSQDGGGDV